MISAHAKALIISNLIKPCAKRVYIAIQDCTTHQQSGFAFPKQPFKGKIFLSIVWEMLWFKAIPLLCQSERHSKVICHTCVTTGELQKMRAPNAEVSFVSQLTNLKLFVINKRYYLITFN